MEKLKNYLNPQSINEVQKPLIFICKIMGVLPLKLVKNNDSLEFKRSWFGLSMSLFYPILALTCFGLRFGSVEGFAKDYFYTEMSEIVNSVQLSFSLKATLLLFIIFFIKKYKFIEILKRFEAADEKFIRINVKSNLKKNLRKILILIISDFTIYAIYFTSSLILLRVSFERPATVLSWASYFIRHIVMSSAMMLFVAITGQIEVRFLYINEVSVNVII